MARRNGLALLGLMVAAMLGLVPVAPAQAADGTWNTTTSGLLWSTSTNWLGGTVANGSGATADFNTLNIIADTTVNLDSARTIGNLIFGDTTASNGWILANNGVAANILTLAGTTPTITVNALASGKTATITGVIAGSSGLTKAGVGTLILNTATNTYTGATNVNEGMLQIGKLESLPGASVITIGPSGTLNLNVNNVTWTNAISGSGMLKVKGGTTNQTTKTGNINFFTGTLDIIGGGKVNIDTADRLPGAGALIRIQSTGTLYFNFAGTPLINNIEMYGGATTEALGQLRVESNANVSGAITLKANTTVGTNISGTGTISGNIGESVGPFGLTKLGAGTLYFTGINTYSGVTTITGGTLVVASAGSLPGWNLAGRYPVASGASLVLGNSFSDSDIATMLGTDNFVAGSNFGFDTSAGNRVYAVSQGGGDRHHEDRRQHADPLRRQHLHRQDAHPGGHPERLFAQLHHGRHLGSALREQPGRPDHRRRRHHRLRPRRQHGHAGLHRRRRNHRPRD